MNRLSQKMLAQADSVYTRTRTAVARIGAHEAVLDEDLALVHVLDEARPQLVRSAPR